MSSRRPSRSASSSNGWGHRTSPTDTAWTLRMVDAGFLGLILLLPFIWGGRQALGNFATVLLSGWTACWWAIHQMRQDRPRWRFSGAEPLFLLGILLVALQTVTLPESLQNGLSPQIDQLLPAWGDNPDTSVGLGRWGTLSFAPWQTGSDLVTLASVMLVFFIAVQRLETVQDVHRLMRYVAVSGCVTAVFGLLQYIAGNGKFYWFYVHPDTWPGTAAKAAFTNANHFADFLAMSMPAQLWWYVVASRSIQNRNLDHPAPTGWRAFAQEWSPAIMLGITSIAILLSQSRGGLLIMGVGMTFAGVLFWRQKLLDSHVVFWLLGVAVCGVAVMVAFGDRLEQKLSADIDAIAAGNSQQIDRAGSRQKIWNTNWKVVQDFPTVGTGLGTHQYVYESYHDYPVDGTLYSHAENGYLQVAMESGITGLAITGLLIGLAGYWCIRGLLQATSQDIRAPCVVASSILVVNLAHSCTDFVWYVPGCMVIVVLAAASACVLHRLSLPPLTQTDSPQMGWGRMGWAVMLALVMTGLGWGVQVKWPEVAAEPLYHEYKRLAQAQGSNDDMNSTRYEIAAILQAAQTDPHNPTYQIRAARAHQRNFLLAHAKDHDMKLDEIRQAALSSNYPTREALYAWLDIPEVMGDNRRHLDRAQAANLRAIRLCPLQPRPYLESAKLAWLSFAPPDVEERLLQQALSARPFDGLVRMEYAHFLNNQGKNDEAIPYFQAAFARDVRCRQAMIKDLSPHHAPSFFLSTFEMDRITLTLLRKAYVGTSDTDGYRNVLLKLAQANLQEATHASGDVSALLIVTAAGCYSELGDNTAAISTLQTAVKRFGNSFPLRCKLANSLYDQGRYSEALPHLEWCHRRRPDDNAMTKRVAVAESRSHLPTQMAEEPRAADQYRQN